MKKFGKQKKQNLSISGFTLVETLVALSIFSVSVLIVVSLLGNSISNIDYAKKKMTASYLAEEGIEYIRNLRDTYTLYDPGGPAQGWTNFLTKMAPCDATSVTTNKCYFDSTNVFSGGTYITTMPVTACSGTCPYMYESSTDGYDYNVAGVKTDFIREIKINKISNDEIKLFSTVYWSQQSGQFSMTFTEELFNWME